MKTWISEMERTQENWELSLVLCQRLPDLEGISLRAAYRTGTHAGGVRHHAFAAYCKRAVAPKSENQQQRLGEILAEGMAGFMTE